MIVRDRLLIGLFSCLASSCLCGLVVAENDADKNWPSFRGPTGNGISETAKPPYEWSTSKNVAWKTEIPGRGTSSPIVWGDKVFLTTAVNAEPDTGSKSQPRLNRQQIFEKFDEDGDGNLNNDEQSKARTYMREETRKSLRLHKFVVMCLDRNSGEKLWEQVAAQIKPIEGHHPDHGYASASPITDGKHLFVNFGTYGIYCYDFSGKQIWKRTDLGEMQTRNGFGEGSSLALFEDSLILPWDHEGQSRIEAIDKTNGKTKWKVNRDEPSNWATPRVITIGDRPQIIHSGENYTRGYDLESGQEIWRSSGLSSRPVATPVVKGNIGYFASSRQGAVLNAYYLDKKGDISGEAAWEINQQAPDCPSLLLSDDRLFYLSGNRGILSCANADDGSNFFKSQRLDGVSGVYSSPVAADGKVFVTGRGGKTIVIKDSTDFDVLSQNEIGEPVDATIALAGNQLFIRGAKHLFCIQETE